MSDKQPIDPGGHDHPYLHLMPVAELLIARGHEPLSPHADHGFQPRPDGWACLLHRPFTAEDRAAVDATFEFPPNVNWFGNSLRDTDNWVDIYGAWTQADRIGQQPSTADR